MHMKDFAQYEADRQESGFRVALALDVEADYGAVAALNARNERAEDIRSAA
jgi:hypothetical protein